MMGRSLVDQFCDAAEEYLRVTGDDPANIAGYLITMTGGLKYAKGEGALSAEELQKIPHQEQTFKDRQGVHGISDLRYWFGLLTTQFAMTEQFLVPSAAQFIQRYLTDRVLPLTPRLMGKLTLAPCLVVSIPLRCSR